MSKTKLALITGASSGIGKELAQIHAESGGDLIVVARSGDKLQALKSDLEKKYAIKVYVIAKDLSLAEAPTEIYQEVKKAGLMPDYLINNAGFGGLGRFDEREWENDRTMLHLNIVALTALCRFFLPDFVARNSGKILNVSSTASLMPGPMQAVYYATKAYVTSFSNAIAEELHATNITVTNLMPGATETEFGRISGMDKTDLFKQTASAQKVASDGYKGMIKGRLNVYSGLPGWMRASLPLIPLLPRKVLLKQIRKMQELK